MEILKSGTETISSCLVPLENKQTQVTQMFILTKVRAEPRYFNKFDLLCTELIQFSSFRIRKNNIIGFACLFIGFILPSSQAVQCFKTSF